jgi:MFS transporter, VNT family, synaptic vesicle glycoprotein 2
MAARLKSRAVFTPRCFVGMMVASYFWGFLGDTQGRRIVILWSLLLSITSTLISVFIKSFAVFAACRFATGIL